MRVFAIDTSCDETSAAIVDGRRVLSSVIYSQALLHEKWGGVMPSVAKRAHSERIDSVVERAFRKAKLAFGDVDAVAVTQGPGLAIALEVGIAKAKELSAFWGKPLVSVNHMEGHIYSNFVQNSKGNPPREFVFPYLVLLVSGGHTELVLFRDHLDYEVIGRTVDDAAGEALDKASKMLGFSYPGGPVIERLAEEAGNTDEYRFPRPLANRDTLNFSYSGLKTAFLYKLRELDDTARAKAMRSLASSYQEAVFATLVSRTRLAVKKTGVANILLGGGVSVNRRLRVLFRRAAAEQGWTVQFPPFKYLNFDNAAMIGVMGCYKAERGLFADPAAIDRKPRMSLPAFITMPSDMKIMKQRDL
ncbi:MAG: tRNA (adenosine(37)-N6)-threonylcarbamoyltransferase complex transferase subunit TsaD [Patescibacteria group bacterium]|nr:tRNA (adenosine(37)-N6)-threonylcarbamoyltransferase complex transferase subunit TsaD [Patescibacteria group bacterium]